MLLITHTKGNGRRLSFLVGERVYDCHDVHPALPETGEELIARWEKLKPLALLMHSALVNHAIKVPLEFIEIGEAVDVEALVWPGM